MIYIQLLFITIMNVINDYQIFISRGIDLRDGVVERISGGR